MQKFLRIAMGMIISLGLLSIEGAAAQDMPVARTAALDSNRISVLTYNVEGLPFPFARGRATAAAEIGTRLGALRAAGQQPHVVVLQEAFGAAQRNIGSQAGYRYVAFGPDRDLKNGEAMSADDRAFAAKASFLKGEGLGKWRGSGLAILSDYPILSVKRMAFPAFACAGYDCMANKGVMLVTLQVPGSTTPVAVIATHLNSKQASGVSKERFGYAFARQVQSIGGFLATALPADMPYVFAGDTNIGKSLTRRATFETMLANLRHEDGVRTALGTCLAAEASCAVETPGEARRAFTHGKDWQVYADGSATSIRPSAIGVPFGHDGNGRMLSDHIGYTASYVLASLASVGAVPVSPSTALR